MFIFFKWPGISNEEFEMKCNQIVNFLGQDIGADELSECVQDFYQNLSDRLTAQMKGPGQSFLLPLHMLCYFL